MAHRTCSEGDCESPVKARGLCSKHYQRWVKAGGQTRTYAPRGSGGRRGANGYIYVWQPDHPLAHADGYVPEHRKVAWDAGILVDPAMVVHHIDHDKANNELSNLEVMWHSDHMVRHVDEDGVVNQHGHWQRSSGACSVEGCERTVKNRGLCAAHYSRLRRRGDVRSDLPVVAGQRLTR